MSKRSASFFEVRREIYLALMIVLGGFITALCLIKWVCITPPYESYLELKKVEPIKDDKVVYDSFSFGPLSLNRNENEIPIPDIQKHIVLLSLNDRRDVKPSQRKFKIGIRGSETKIVGLNDRVYLGFVEGQQDRIKFDDIPSPIWIRVREKEGNPTLEVGLDVIDEVGEKVVQNRRHFALQVEQELVSDEELDPLLLQFCEALEKCECYIPDRLYEVYGDHTDAKRGKYRLEVTQQKEKHVIFVEQATPLFFSDGQIRENEVEGPCAQVTHVDDDHLHLCVWDQSGLQKRIVKFALNKGVPVDFRLEDAIRRLRKRTASSVSCLLGNKSSQMKRGDWAIHTKMGWKVIKSQSDFFDVVNQRIVGELFVFDEMVKKNGSYEMIGHFFDESRSQVLDVSLPFADIKKKSTPTYQEDMGDEMFDSFDSDDEFDDDEAGFEYFDFDF